LKLSIVFHGVDWGKFTQLILYGRDRFLLWLLILLVALHKQLEYTRDEAEC